MDLESEDSVAEVVARRLVLLMNQRQELLAQIAVEHDRLGLPIVKQKQPNAKRKLPAEITLRKAWGRYADLAIHTGTPQRENRLRDTVKTGKRLRVAAIMDAFTQIAFSYECDIVNLHPQSWLSEIESELPDLLFVESAWRGHEDSWRGKIYRRSPELVELVQWCQSKGIVTVFWNKEDPVHYEDFIKTASLFDHVFTTDNESIPNYIHDLGHDRVHLLMFAAQTQIFNPILDQPRKAAAVFAGSYYPFYPRRNADLFAEISGVSQVLPVEIFDRNFNRPDNIYDWPSPYNEMVIGCLPPEKMALAYKGYKVALNVNTVKHSKTMCARRIYELLACGTPVVSNFSRSIRVLFGDLAIASDDAAEIAAAVRELADDPVRTAKLAAIGVRHIMSHHTYSHRFAELISVLTAESEQSRSGQSESDRPDQSGQFEHTKPGQSEPNQPNQSRSDQSEHPQPNAIQHGWPRLGFIACEDDPSKLQELLATIQAFAEVSAQLVVLTDAAAMQTACQSAGIPHLSQEQAAQKTLGEQFGDCDGVGILAADRWYGAYYAISLANALRYSDADVVGKATRFGEDLALCDGDLENVWLDAVPELHRAILRQQKGKDLSLGEICAAALPSDFRALGVDRFDYCETIPPQPEMFSAQLPLRVAATPEEISAAASVKIWHEIDPAFYPASFWDSEKQQRLVVDHQAGGTNIIWENKSSAEMQVPFERFIPTTQLGKEFRLKMTAGLGKAKLHIGWLNAADEWTRGPILLPGKCHCVKVPPDATRMRLYLSLAGSGVISIQSIALPDAILAAPLLPTKGDSHTLVISNVYPDLDNLYAHAYVHSRLKGYARHGKHFEVFVPQADSAELEYREYQGVPVFAGDNTALRTLLENGHYRHIAVHTLQPQLWEWLKEWANRAKITIWVHGAELQDPARRTALGISNTDAASQRSAENRFRMWGEVSKCNLDNLKLVFVSDSLRREAIHDAKLFGVDLLKVANTVLPNPIDTAVFDYQPKDIALRKHILLIRPFVSNIYANDLSIAAIELLRKEPWFAELHFTIVGNGPLFDSQCEPLHELPNVTLHKGYLPHAQIAELHKHHGVFLVPTRMDSQGVSRDEAMSSGLVPITSDIPVVREFCSKTEGYLVREDDPAGIAAAIKELFDSPEIFSKKSAAAAARIRKTICNSLLIPRELELLGEES